MLGVSEVSVYKIGTQLGGNTPMLPSGPTESQNPDELVKYW